MLKLSVVQFCPELNQKEHNLKRINEFIDKSDSELIVFPELATTGYFFLSKEETMQYAETADGDTISSLQAKSTDSGKIIVIGFIERENEKVFNSAAVITPDKSFTSIYRKTHLFYRERFCFDEGDSGFFVIDYKPLDLKIGTMICYDWRFPEASRSLGILGADLIVCPSNLVTNIWHLAMPARAIENKVYLAVANRTGIESRVGEELVFTGMSAIYSYNGSSLVKAGKGEDTTLTVYIEPEKTRDKSFNPYNDIFKDRRPDMYI
jgi:5-aminopentanamidase